MGKAFSDMGRSYATRVREIEKDGSGQIGPPRFHLVNSLLKWAFAQEIGAVNRMQLQEIIIKERYNEGWNHMIPHVCLVKTAKCYDQKYRQLFICMQCPSARS